MFIKKILSLGFFQKKNTIMLSGLFPSIFKYLRHENEGTHWGKLTFIADYNLLLDEVNKCTLKELPQVSRTLRILMSNTSKQLIKYKDSLNLPKMVFNLYVLRLNIMQEEFKLNTIVTKKTILTFLNQNKKRFKRLSDNEKREVKWYRSYYQLQEFVTIRETSREWFDLYQTVSASLKTQAEKESLHRLYSDLRPKISKSMASEWVDLNNKLTDKESHPNLLGFINLFPYIEGAPDSQLFKRATQSHFSFQDLSGQFSSICIAHSLESLENKEIFDFNITAFPYQENPQTSELITNYKDSKIHSFEYSLLGEGSSLRRFAAHLQLNQFSFKFENIKGLSKRQQTTFEVTVLETLKQHHILNSSDGLTRKGLPSKTVIRDIIIKALETVIQQPVSSQWIAVFDIDQFEKGYIQYNAQNQLLSGLPQDHALALFNKALITHKWGLNETNSRSIKNCLHRCLDIYLKVEELFTDSSTTEFTKPIQELAGTILDEFFDQKHAILIPTGECIPYGEKTSNHSFYLVLRHRNELPELVIIDGHPNYDTYFNERDLEDEEIKYRYGKVYTLKDNDKETLQDYLVKAIKTPFCYEVTPLIFNPPFQEVYSNEDFPVQLSGTCTIHNLKYSLKAAFNMDAIQFGNMICSELLGVDELCKNFEPLPKQTLSLQEPKMEVSLRFGDTIIQGESGFIIPEDKLYVFENTLDLLSLRSEFQTKIFPDINTYTTFIDNLRVKKEELNKETNSGLIISVKIDELKTISFTMCLENGYLVAMRKEENGTTPPFKKFSNISYNKIPDFSLNSESILSFFEEAFNWPISKDTIDVKSMKSIATIAFFIAESMRVDIIKESVIKLLRNKKINALNWMTLKLPIINNYKKACDFKRLQGVEGDSQFISNFDLINYAINTTTIKQTERKLLQETLLDVFKTIYPMKVSHELETASIIDQLNQFKTKNH